MTDLPLKIVISAENRAGGALSLATGDMGKMAKAVDSVRNYLVGYVAIMRHAIPSAQQLASSLIRASDTWQQLGDRLKLATGKTKGEEFERLLAEMPALTDALARGVGVSTDMLLRMIHEGILGMSALSSAVIAESQRLGKEAAELPLTMAAAWKNLSVAIYDAANRLNDFFGASSKLAAMPEHVMSYFRHPSAAYVTQGI